MDVEPLPRIGEGIFFQRPIAIAAELENERGDQPSATAPAGTDSSTSSSSTTTNNARGGPTPRKPVRGTANR